MSVGSRLRDSIGRLFGWKRTLHRLVEMRFCVIDVDVTGISIRNDRVTGVAALPVVAGAFRLSDLRYFTVPSPAAAGGNRAAQRQASDVLAHLIAGSPVVTYNAHFVRQMMRRAGLLAGLSIPDADWIDLESAAGVVASEDRELTSMGYWLEKMREGSERVHDATYDVFTMAQMLQALLSYCEDAGVETLESLIRIQNARAWLRKRA